MYLALSATMTVLSDINSAPIAGDTEIPNGSSMPAAKGRAITLILLPREYFG